MAGIRSHIHGGVRALILKFSGVLLWLIPLFTFEPFFNLRVNFERRVFFKNRTEVTKGVIYYFEGRKFVEVNFPVHQIMFLEKNLLTIYYPEQKKAFEIISPAGSSLPFFDMFLLPSKRGFFKEKGFMEVEKRDDYVKYSAPPGMSTIIDEVELFFDAKGRLKRLIEKRKKEVRMKAEFSGYVEFMGFPYPIKIIIDGKKRENISFSELKFNVELPDMVENFRLPPDTDIRRIKF